MLLYLSMIAVYFVYTIMYWTNPSSDSMLNFYNLEFLVVDP